MQKQITSELIKKYVENEKELSSLPIDKAIQVCEDILESDNIPSFLFFTTFNSFIGEHKAIMANNIAIHFKVDTIPPCIFFEVSKICKCGI